MKNCSRRIVHLKNQKSNKRKKIYISLSLVRANNKKWCIPSIQKLFSWVLQYLIHQHANFALHVLTQYSKFDNVIRNIQNKLGKRALKSDLKSTATVN